MCNDLIRKIASVLVVVFFLFVTTNQIFVHFLCVDEVGHLPAAEYHWRKGRFELYRVNPPLVRTVAFASEAFLGTRNEFRWTEVNSRVGLRPEFIIGVDYLANKRLDAMSAIIIPRISCLIFPLLGGALLYLLLRPHSKLCGFFALVFWFFSPETISNGACITPDLGAVSLGLLIVFTSCIFLKHPSVGNTIIVGFSVGMALLSKLTWIILVPIIPILLCGLCTLLFREKMHVRFVFRCCFVSLIGCGVLNVFYLMEGTGKSIGDYRFCSELLGGPGCDADNHGNRFEASMLASIPVFLPYNYVLGVDYLRMEVERKYWSFLDGEWRFGSWPYYYVLTTLYKTPEPTLIAAAMGVYIFLVGWWRALMKPELVSMVLLLTIPAAVCFLSVSLQGGFNHHHRYVLMIYPPMFVFASLLASPMAEQVFSRKKLVAIGEDSHESESASVSKAPIPWWAIWQRYHWTKILAVVLVSLSVASTLRVHPYYTSYFNTLSGGPENGWHRLGFSNIDWGQDILEVDQWLKKYPERRPLVMDIDYFEMNGDLFDVPTSLPPRLPLGASVDEVRRSITETQWWIISVKKLYNLPDQPGLQYLQQIEPVERIAYAYHVYRIDPLPPEESSSPNEPTP